MTQNKFPRQSEKHSSAAQREVKGKPVEIFAEQTYGKIMPRRGKASWTSWNSWAAKVQTVNEIYAAEAAAACCLGSDDSDSSQRPLTSLETPGSCMVTP